MKLTKPENVVSTRHSIATKLLRVVFALYIIVVAAVTISHMIMEYRYQKSNISHDLEDVQRTFEQELAVDMWKMDEESLQSTVRGMLELPTIIGVTIDNDSGNNIAIGGIVEQDGEVGKLDLHVHILSFEHSHPMVREEGDDADYELFEHHFPIVYTYQGQEKQLGEATIYSSTSVILRRVRLGFLLLIVATVFKITVLWFIFLWVFRSILKRPLSILTEATEKVDLENLENAKVDIKRDGNDELTLLESSFNSMITNLQVSLADRKQAEEKLQEGETRYRELFDNMSSGVAVYEPVENGSNFVFKGLNRAGERINNVKREDVVGQKVTEMFPGIEEFGLLDVFRRVYKTGKPEHHPVTVYKDDRGLAWFENYVYKLPSGEIVAVHDNVTERKRAEEEVLAKSEQLRASNQQLTSSEQQLKASNQQLLANEQEREKLLKTLETKNDELQSIVYIASHDLKSPLVNISGFSALLNESCEELTGILRGLDIGDGAMQRIQPLTDEDIPESLKFISASTSKMKSLLDGLLQVSRIGSQEINIETLDMNRMMQHITDTFAFQINEADVEVSIEHLPDCRGDEKQVNQVFSNIIDNALKYFTSERKGSIKISGESGEKESIYCIEDNGMGIHKDHQYKVFQLFHRLNPDDSTEGQGIGLTITKRALDRNSGWAWVESEPGKGSKFFVSLPASPK